MLFTKSSSNWQKVAFVLLCGNNTEFNIFQQKLAVKQRVVDIKKYVVVHEHLFAG